MARGPHQWKAVRLGLIVHKVFRYSSAGASRPWAGDPAALGLATVAWFGALEVEAGVSSPTLVICGCVSYAQLVHIPTGRRGTLGGPRTNRSGLASNCASSTRWRASNRSFALPSCTQAGDRG